MARVVDRPVEKIVKQTALVESSPLVIEKAVTAAPEAKAAVSITARQLESLGLLRRVWKPGDRRSYYRSADNIATAVQEGLMAFLSQKIRAAASELEAADALLGGAAAAARHDPEVQFVHSRVKRARVLQSRLQKVLTSPLLKIFTKV